MKQALVVDDSRAMRSILRVLLTELGFSVTEAPNGKAALSIAKEHGPYDLAMVDWNMPEMNGLELVTAIRSDATFNPMLIMMCTTETEMSQVERAITAGANEYVMKPFTKDILRDKLAILRPAA